MTAPDTRTDRPAPTTSVPAVERRPEPDDATAGWQLVALREISVKLRDKAFVGSTIFILVAIVAGFVITELLGGRSSEHTVAVVDGAGAAVVQAADELAGPDADRLRPREAADVAQAQEWVADGDVEAVLLPLADAGSGAQGGQTAQGGQADQGEQALGSRWEVVGSTGVEDGVFALLAQAVQAQELGDNAVAAGTSADEVLAGTLLQERLLDVDAIPEGAQYGIGFAFAMLFYLTALTFGLAIAQSVVEEKQSRVVEILVAAVPVRQLLAGKVVGNSVLAIGQVVLLVTVGLIGLSVTGQAGALSPVLAAGGWFVVFFVFGFAALACLWAVAGSVATRQEDLQSTSMPMTTLVMLALFGGLFAEGSLQTVLSFVPLASTVAMPARMLAGDVALWQPLLAALLVAVAAVLLVRLGARMYEGSVLQTDRRVSFREALRRS